MEPNPLSLSRRADLMTQEQIDQLSKTVERLTSFFNMIRIVGALFGTVVCGIVGMALWVNNTSTALAETQHAVANIVKSREQVLAEWGKWREQKDSIDVRMIVLFESQQALNKRIEDRQDKIREFLGGIK